MTVKDSQARRSRAKIVAFMRRHCSTSPREEDSREEVTLQISSHWRLFAPELQIVEPAVETSGAEELLMSSLLYDLPALEYHNLVRVAHGGQPVSDHQHGSLAHQPFDGLLHQPLGLG